jgi:hypothetical protein
MPSTDRTQTCACTRVWTRAHNVFDTRALVNTRALQARSDARTHRNAAAALVSHTSNSGATAADQQKAHGEALRA